MEDSYRQDSALDTLNHNKENADQKTEGKHKISHLFAVTIDFPPVLVETDEEEEDKGEEEKREGTKTKHQWFQVLFCFLGVLLKNSEWTSQDGNHMYWMSRL